MQIDSVLEDRYTSSTLSGNCDTSWVATELFDVTLYPLQQKVLIIDTSIGSTIA